VANIIQDKIEALKLAKYVIWYSNNARISITHLKLQKILYYLQGAYLSEYRHPLFDDIIEAWPYGPVVRSVYYAFCAYGSLPLRVPDEAAAFCNELNEDVRSLINEELDKKLPLSARKLVNMSHRELPWFKHRIEVGQGKKPIITDNDMREFFCKS